VPTGVLPLVVTVKVAGLLEASSSVTDEGLKLALAPVGRPLTLRLICPVKPPEGLRVRL
jgi:hypothetical protein